MILCVTFLGDTIVFYANVMYTVFVWLKQKGLICDWL